jgi:hypothetical protein
MTITVSDLKLYYPANTDPASDEGGGHQTYDEIPDNTLENVFLNISRVDRVTGDVQAMRVWFANKSAGLEILKDALCYLEVPPSDPKTFVTLAKTGLKTNRELFDVLESAGAADALFDPITLSAVAASSGDSSIALNVPSWPVYDRLESAGTVTLHIGLKSYLAAVSGYDASIGTIRVYLTLQRTLDSDVANGEDVIVSPAPGQDIPGLEVVGVSKLADDALSGSYEITVNDVTTKVAPTLVSRKSATGSVLLPAPVTSELTAGSVIQYDQQYNDDNALAEYFSGKDFTGYGSVYGSPAFAAPVQSGSFKILRASDGSTYDVAAQGAWRSIQAPDNTLYLYPSGGSPFLLADAGDYDAVQLYWNGAWRTVSALNRTSGQLERLCVSAANTALLINSVTGISNLKADTLYGGNLGTFDFDPADPVIGDNNILLKFAANSISVSGIPERVYDVLPNQGALTTYSAELPEGVYLPSLKLSYEAKTSAFYYYEDVLATNGMSQGYARTRYGYGPTNSYVGNFGGASKLNIFPVRYGDDPDVSPEAYESGFYGSSSIAANQDGTYTLTIELADANQPNSAIYLEYLVYNDVVGEYQPPPTYQISKLLASPGNFVPDSFVATWTESGVSKSASSDGNGDITGNASGTFNAPGKSFSMSLPTYPDDGRVIYSYQADVESTKTGSHSVLSMFYPDGIVIVRDGVNEELAMLDGIDPVNKILFLRGPLQHRYSAGATVAGVLSFGNLYARESAMSFFSAWNDTSWTGTGAPNNAAYNAVDYPVVLTNIGCVAGNWVVEFTSSTEFNVKERERGIVGTGNTSTDTAINGPNAEPYFTLLAAGFSGTWQVGEGFSFQTYGNAVPIYCIRGVNYGSSLTTTDSCRIVFGGDL